MAGYCPSYFLHFYGPRQSRDQERDQYPAILSEQAWSIKGSLYGQKITPKNFTFTGTKQAIPSGKDRPTLPTQVANQNTGFASSCQPYNKYTCDVKGP